MSVIWFNSEFLYDTLPLDPADRGLMLGDGLFETIAVASGQAIWLDEHIARLVVSAMALGILCDEADLRVSISKVLKRSSALHEVLRITLTRGVTTRGLAAEAHQSSLLISLLPFDLAHQPQSLTLATSTIRRNQTAPSSMHKTLSYIDSVAAAREVKGKADDALMLNSAGNVACSTVGNIFILKDEVLVTPSDDQGILPGITRAKILSNPDFKARQEIVTIDDLFSADAVFLTNSLRLVTPITKLDDKLLGTKSVQHIKDYLKGLFP